MVKEVFYGAGSEGIIRRSAPTEIADKVIYCFSDRMKVLNRFYPDCPAGCCENCREDCEYPGIRNMYRLLYTIRKNNPVSQEKIAEIINRC